MMLTKLNLFLEFTVTNNCNCKCSYCFEGDHPYFQNDKKIEDRQIQLLIEAANNFDKSKYLNLAVSFWGGEPFLNLEFIDRIFNATYNYDFIGYHFYTNGTLTNKIQEFVNRPYIDKVRDKIHVLLSYDGEPHHTIKRGNNSKNIFKSADILIANKIKIAFKATLSYDMLLYLPEIWKSYYDLYLRYGDCALYYPTFDTQTNCDISIYLDNFRAALKTIMQYEYEFVIKHSMNLWKWFSRINKPNCNIANSIHMHTDGNIYICHGAAYKCNNKKMILGNIFDINSVYDVIQKQIPLLSLPITCINCVATNCLVCHIANLHENDNPYNEWSNCRVNNIDKCKFYKEFGYISKILLFVLIKHGVILNYG